MSAQYSGYTTTICKIRFCPAHAKRTGGDGNVGQSEACPTKETPKTTFLKVFALVGVFTYGPVYMWTKKPCFHSRLKHFLSCLIWWGYRPDLGRLSNSRTWRVGRVFGSHKHGGRFPKVFLKNTAGDVLTSHQKYQFLWPQHCWKLSSALLKANQRCHAYKCQNTVVPHQTYPLKSHLLELGSLAWQTSQLS